MTIYVPDPRDQAYWDGLMSSWLLDLEARRKAPATIVNYRWAPLQFADWLAETKRPTNDVHDITPELVREWLAHIGNTKSDSTARSRYVALRQWCNWLMAEREVDTDPMENVTQPHVVEKVAKMLTAEQVTELLESCSGPLFSDVRDKAIFMLLGDTGMRRGAIAGMQLDHVDLRERIVAVTTKGSKHIVVPFGANTARALDKYLRMRRRERYSDGKWFWLSSTGKGRLSDNGILQMMRRRGKAIGVPNLHPHMFRHTFADSWLEAGGQEGDLMAIAGWESERMVRRYGAARRAARAREAHRRLSPMDNRD